MLKQEKLDITQTNMALFGSDIEKEIKKHAADGEPAWKSAGKEPGIQVWRVEKFQIKEWPKNHYGNFFDGDSYIVLHTYKKDDKVLYNVHFWLGENTSQDEAGTAAYKTVELDDHLGGLPVQFREVQGYESKEFLHLFPKIVIQHGGIDSGFNHVTPETYRPRLLHVKGTIARAVVREVPLTTSSLNSGDVFVVDLGTEVLQFNGKGSGGGERSKAAQLVRGIDDERGSKVGIIVLDESDEKESPEWKKFWETLGGKKAIKLEEGQDKAVTNIKQIYKVSDASGKMSFTEVPFKKSSLLEDDVFVCAVGPTVYAWCGNRATPNEKKAGISFAQQYLNNHPSLHKATPIIRILSGAENEEFWSFFL